MSEALRMHLGFVVEPEVRQFCGPLFFTRSLKVATDNITASGSFGLVDTGKRKLLVTCLHVWEEFQKAKLADPDLMMCLCLDKGNPVVFAPDEPLGEDRELDVATFQMESLLPACDRRKFYPLHQNPARRVAKGDKLFLIGFPGYLRLALDEFVKFGRQPYGIGVASVDGLLFHSDISRLNLDPRQFAGISGCPCFLVREDRPIQLVGFATSLVLSRYLGFVHSRCLDVDGKINRRA
jgi:hypothetical protein